ncbi:MAG: 1,4-dihydroxy-2-naphthoate octaprenyltransferase [Nitrosomonadaceae bacterium]|nr:1,4-dihydroxy-2-naphthoate octaprenyltransferase [Nitrosomonadaceae bacterium]
MSQARLWILGSRPRTLPAAIAPVLVGTGAASPFVIPGRALLALVVALSLQIGVNFANDYSAGIRGSDSKRVGPMRLVGSGKVSATQVRTVAFLFFFIGALAGLWLALLTTLWLILVGAISILAAWGYTGGKKPYGYRGWGEVSVFIFFGFVAVVGTYYVQTERVDFISFIAAIPMGSLACALLLTNNLRDLPRDAQVGKETLAVRLGDQKTRTLYQIALFISFLSIALLAGWRAGAVLTLTSGIFVIEPLKAIRAGAKGMDLLPVLAATGKTQLAFSVFLAFGLAVSA